MDLLVIKKRFEYDTKKLMENTIMLEKRNMEVIKCEYPYFVISMIHPKSSIKYYFSFKCDDFPLSMQVVDQKSFEPVRYECWPHGSSFLESHNVTGLPFLCIDGLKEYHTYTGHDQETQWNLDSDDYRLVPMVERVYVKFLNAEQ